MNSNATPTVEISIAMLSWINDQLRASAMEEPSRSFSFTAWAPSVVTLLAVGLCGFCVVVLQGWT